MQLLSSSRARVPECIKDLSEKWIEMWNVIESPPHFLGFFSQFFCCVHSLIRLVSNTLGPLSSTLSPISAAWKICYAFWRWLANIAELILSVMWWSHSDFILFLRLIIIITMMLQTSPHSQREEKTRRIKKSLVFSSFWRKLRVAKLYKNELNLLMTSSARRLTFSAS